MSLVKITKELRDKLNKYLQENYDIQLSKDREVIYSDKYDYLFMNEENEEFIYIPKNKIK